MSTAAYGFDQLASAGAQAGYDKVQRKREALDEERRQKASDLIGTRNGILSKMPTLLGPNGEKTPEYDAAYQSLTQAQQDLGQLYHPDKAPGALQKDWHYLLEKMHGIPAAVERKVLPAAPMVMQPIDAPSQSWGDAQVAKQKDASLQKAQEQAKLLASGIPLTPSQQSMATLHDDEIARQSQIDSTLRIAKNLGLSDTAMDELKQQMLGLKNTIPKALTGAAGIPYKGADGLYYQNVTEPDGTVGRRSMPPDWKPNTKAIRGTLVNSKEHGWIQTWVNPYTLQVMGWQKVTPGSRYTGTTRSSSSTDSMGVTTSTSGTTTPSSGSNPVDIDLSGMQQLPENYNGEDTPAAPTSTPTGTAPTSAAPPSGSPSSNPSPKSASPSSVTTPTVNPKAHPKVASPTPQQLKNKVPAPPPTTPSATSGQYQVDAKGHIPEEDIKKYGLNRNMVQVANNILDGADVSKIGLKDRGAAEDLAGKYGWGGQGLFTPQDLLTIRESANYLDKALTDPSLKTLDSNISRGKMMNAIHAAGENSGITSKALATMWKLTPEESAFVTTYLQLVGTITGLGKLTRGSKPTEGAIKRLMLELPNPVLTGSSQEAKNKIKALRSEIDVAMKKRSFDDLNNPNSSSDNPQGGLSLDDFKKKHKLQ